MREREREIKKEREWDEKGKEEKKDDESNQIKNLGKRDIKIGPNSPKRKSSLKGKK